MPGQDTSFNPAVHWWPFDNSGWDEARVYEILGVPLYSDALCGGMALAALDFYMHNISIPRNLSRPSTGDPLYDHIVQRQRDSLGAMVPGFVRYVAHDPFESHHARWQHLVREDQHLGIIQRYVARNEPIILGLLNRYVGIPTSPQNSHHQVLVTGWEKRGPSWGDVRIKIYDPNHPNRTVILVPVEGAGPPLDRFGRSDYDRYVPTWDGTLDTIIREGNYNFWGAGFPHDGLPARRPPAWAPWFQIHPETVFNQVTPVAAVARRQDHLDLFKVGFDGAVWSSWWHQGETWSPWFQIHPRTVFAQEAPVTALARRHDHLDLFITGRDGAVWSSGWHEGQSWSPWFQIHPGTVFRQDRPVVAVARMPDHIDLFRVGFDGAVWSSWWHQGESWSQWLQIHPETVFPKDARVTALARRQDHLDLFVVGHDGAVWSSWWHQGESWSPWFQIHPETVFRHDQEIVAISRMSEHIDLFTIGHDGAVWSSWWHQGETWSQWFQIHPETRFAVTSRVTAIARASDRLDLFVTGRDGAVWSSWWHADNVGWRPWFQIHPSTVFAQTHPVGVVARKREHVDLFKVGFDGAVWSAWWSPS